MSADDETYSQWLARMWRVASGLENLRPAEQKVVAQHVLDNSGKVTQNELTLFMLREAKIEPEALDSRLDAVERAELATAAALRNADGRHPIDSAGRFKISG